MSRAVKVIADVTAVDAGAGHDHLAGPAAQCRPRRQDKELLRDVRVGDQIFATYEELTVLSITPTPPAGTRETAARQCRRLRNDPRKDRHRDQKTRSPVNCRLAAVCRARVRPDQHQYRQQGRTRQSQGHRPDQGKGDRRLPQEERPFNLGRRPGKGSGIGPATLKDIRGSVTVSAVARRNRSRLPQTASPDEAQPAHSQP